MLDRIVGSGQSLATSQADSEIMAALNHAVSHLRNSAKAAGCSKSPSTPSASGRRP